MRPVPFLLVILIALTCPPIGAQQASQNTSSSQPTGGILGRPSPPQPVQKQGVEYFAGTWTFKWTGRESAFTPGPRTGTITFTRLGDTPFLEYQARVTADGAGAYQESGTLGWHATQKVVALHERLWGNVEILSVGDWSSPISIRLESSPIRVKDEMLRLRRTYGIVSGSSFTVSEEISVDGGAFVRLGGGVFTKTSK
ncbi:MAG TPA: hypothetical protein VMO26_13090 [Vicinamibacterales bacterium]|nr:hypothetical protein [Vicinamibacterales bacterium]